MTKLLTEGVNDNLDYMCYVLNEKNQICSGWEHKEDAKDDIEDNKDFPPYANARIFSRKYITQKGIDPSKDENWFTTTNESLNESTKYEQYADKILSPTIQQALEGMKKFDLRTRSEMGDVIAEDFDEKTPDTMMSVAQLGEALQLAYKQQLEVSVKTLNEFASCSAKGKVKRVEMTTDGSLEFNLDARIDIVVKKESFIGSGSKEENKVEGDNKKEAYNIIDNKNVDLMVIEITKASKFERNQSN